MLRRRKKHGTIICLVLVITVALLLRGFVIYHFFSDQPPGRDRKTKRSIRARSLFCMCAYIRRKRIFRRRRFAAAGAVGLMQVLPETGEWAAEKIGIENYSEAMLLEPSVNIEIGQLVSQLSLRFVRRRHRQDPRGLQRRPPARTGMDARRRHRLAPSPV